MKVYAFKIPKKPRENITVQNDKGPAFYDKLHQHEEIQISQILEGTGKLIAGDSVHSFQRGDLFVIGSGMPHFFKSAASSKNSQMVSLFFRKDSFGSNFFDIEEMKELQGFFSNAKTGFKTISTNRKIVESMKGLISLGHFSRFMVLIQLLKDLSDSPKAKLSGFVQQKQVSNDQGERLRAVFDYVMKNFDQKIELNTVAKLVHMTPNAFCRFFKERTNKTFFRFLIEVRVEHVCQLLINHKDMPIVEAANTSGFNSISNFNRMFREIKGTNPTEYLQHLY
jgi:AraC-like DNA-binding protein